MFSSGPSPDKLNQAQVTIYSQETCNSRQVLDGTVFQSMFCAGKLRGGVDTCQASQIHAYMQHGQKQARVPVCWAVIGCPCSRYRVTAEAPWWSTEEMCGGWRGTRAGGLDAHWRTNQESTATSATLSTGSTSKYSRCGAEISSSSTNVLNTPRKLVAQDIRHAVKNKRTLGKVPRIISSVCLRPSNVATGKSFWERLEQVTQATAFKHVFKGMVCKSKSLACSLLLLAISHHHVCMASVTGNFAWKHVWDLGMMAKCPVFKSCPGETAVFI